jgi:serine phosphatase RsbU (regulator of sigma subunit)
VYYLFTDGYADQFDKNDLKKFSVKKLKNLFTEIAKENNQTQYDTLEKELYDWKGNTKQIDDITVIGVKI